MNNCKFLLRFLYICQMKKGQYIGKHHKKQKGESMYTLITVNISKVNRDRLYNLSFTEERSRSFLVNKALDIYLDMANK